MKAVMYHYVRPTPEGLDHFRYLHLGHFCRQLDYFANEFGFISRHDFENTIARGEPVRGVFLTFDDGLLDHHTYVLPALVKRGLWGIFYVPTGMYARQKLLGVHRVHLLLGRLGGARCMELLHRSLTDQMLIPELVEEFHQISYRRQNNDAATIMFKRAINYFISYDCRETVLDELMRNVLDDQDEATLFRQTYVSREQIRELDRAGMIIGSHGTNHLLMSRLPTAEQRLEISDSVAFISAITGKPVTTFAYPYGGFHSFTDETEALLSASGVQYSLNVEWRDITANDLRNRPQALPRFDCNQFPFGTASMGPALAKCEA